MLTFKIYFAFAISFSSFFFILSFSIATFCLLFHFLSFRSCYFVHTIIFFFLFLFFENFSSPLALFISLFQIIYFFLPSSLFHSSIPVHLHSFLPSFLFHLVNPDNRPIVLRFPFCVKHLHFRIVFSNLFIFIGTLDFISSNRQDLCAT